MDKRQIEKAVNEYIGHPEEVGEGIDTYMRRKAFMDGANWRIDSLWHDASENPEMYKYLLVEDEFKNHFSIYKLVGQDWKDMVYHFHIFRWAYVEDLMPERKED